MEEIWKDIPEYEGIYQVSNKGEVRSLDRIVYQEVNGVKSSYIKKGRILKKSLSKPCYYAVALCSNSTQKTFRIHQLVAMAFLNHVPDKYKKVVDHINRDTKDNSLSNLRVVSHRDNILNNIKNKKGSYYSKEKGKYVSSIHIKGKPCYLGSFNSEKEASEAYLKAKMNVIKYVNNKQFRKLLHEL